MNRNEWISNCKGLKEINKLGNGEKLKRFIKLVMSK